MRMTMLLIEDEKVVEDLSVYISRGGPLSGYNMEKEQL